MNSFRRHADIKKVKNSLAINNIFYLGYILLNNVISLQNKRKGCNRYLIYEDLVTLIINFLNNLL